MAEENQQSAGAAAPSGSSSKLVMIASLVNMVATVGIVAVLFLSYQKEKGKPSIDDIVNGQAKGAAASHGGGHGGEHGGGHGEGAKGEGGTETLADSGKIIALEPFTVNLSTGVGTAPRYVRMNVSVELEQGVPDKEFDIKLPRVRDTVINLLNSKKAADMAATEGREQLKDEIKRAVNLYMNQSRVKGVYFTNFTVSN